MSSDVPSATSMKSAGNADTPGEWVEFLRYLLRTDPQGYKDRFAADPATIDLTPEKWAKLKAIVNSLPLKTYKHSSGQPWRDDLGATEGDCNTAVMQRRRALAQAGFPLGALRPAAVDNMEGDRHLVLTIATNKGDFVVDGIPRPMIQPWDRAPFKWLMRLNGHKWERLQ